MAHKVLIGGTDYGIKGGKTLINGTTYSVKKGGTLVGGTGYDISLGQQVTIRIDTVSNYYYSNAAVYINGKFATDLGYDEGTGEQSDYITVNVGDSVQIYFDYIGGSYVEFGGCTGFKNYTFINDNEFNGTVTGNGSVSFTIW